MTATNSASDAEFIFPASFAQQRLWVLNSLAPKNPFYNVSAAIELQGQLNITALEQTFNEIVRRHEVLRTTFEMTAGQLHQVILEDVTVSLPVVDLSYLPASERKAAARQQAIAQSQSPCDLGADMLLRLTIFQIEPTDHILLLNLHHIIADGWSIGVLVQEISILYAAFNAGEPSPLPDLIIQYADFASWQLKWLQGEVLESQLSYWRSQLTDLPVLNLPTDRTRQDIPTYRGATHKLELSASLTTSLEALSQQENVTLFMTLLAAFQTLLYRYTGQEDIAVGSPIANRNRAELEPLIGFFVNSLVLRINLSGNPSFRELLQRVREVTLGAYAHQDLPFEKLVQELHPQRDLSRHPLFQVAIALQNTPITALELPGLVLTQFDFDPATSRLDLELHLWQTPEGLKGQVIYSTDLFDSSTITSMLGHFQILLAGIVVDPEQRLIELPILTATERQQLLWEWNNTQNYFCNQCIHQLFEAQANKTPEATALIYKDEQLTYRELNNRSNQLAHYLQKLSVAPEVKVGLCVERSIDMVVAILGIFKAGGAYVPLDPTYPPERLQFMLQDAQVCILLTQQALAPLFNGNWRHQLICLDSDRDIIAQQSLENIVSSVTEANLAYLIYTSGSTGQPKGVLIEHRGLINLAQAQIQIFALKPEHRILQFASPSFDASIFEIIMALAVGATLYIVPEKARLGGALISYLQQHAITHATLTPAVIMSLPPAQLPALQILISAGEACSLDVARWGGTRRLFNAYGLTETTIWATVNEVTDSSGNAIGRAIANTQIYILNAHLQPQPIGIPGEIYIGGVGLARGYFNRPDLTAQRFIPNPFTTNEQLETQCFSPLASRLYKTGDIARYLPDGNLEFLGRLDDQVKIRGYRIELAEIESFLCQHPAVKAAIVISEHIPDNKQLVAHVVPSATLSVIELRRFLQKKLPDYMIPAAFVIQSALPLTPSGKVDRNTLKSISSLENYASSIDNPQTERYVAPRTATEATLTKLWLQILNLQQVGIQDNFFELGGDSLLVVNLMEQVNQQFKQNLPLSDLFLAPTIEQLAFLIDKHSDPNSNSSLSWSPLVPLQPAGDKLPFFCVHPIFGVVLPYYELALHLGKDQPFYGLQPFGIDGSHPPLKSIEEMAAHYIKAVRQVQPQGPYRLGGWSFGGLVAFEMAQQLQQAGQVSFLAILDTLAPVASNQPSFGDGLKFLFTTASSSIYPFLLDYWSLIRQQVKPDLSYQPRTSKFSIPALEKIITPRAWRSLLERATIKYLIPQETRLRMLDELTIHRIMRIFYTNSRATLKYTPSAYPKAITLFRTKEALSKSDDPTLGWNQIVASGVQVHLIPGNHLTMLKKPHVEILAELLGNYLNNYSH